MNQRTIKDLAKEVHRVDPKCDSHPPNQQTGRPELAFVVATCVAFSLLIMVRYASFSLLAMASPETRWAYDWSEYSLGHGPIEWFLCFFAVVWSEQLLCRIAKARAWRFSVAFGLSLCISSVGLPISNLLIDGNVVLIVLIPLATIYGALFYRPKPRHAFFPEVRFQASQTLWTMAIATILSFGGDVSTCPHKWLAFLLLLATLLFILVLQGCLARSAFAIAREAIERDEEPGDGYFTPTLSQAILLACQDSLVVVICMIGIVRLCCQVI